MKDPQDMTTEELAAQGWTELVEPAGTPPFVPVQAKGMTSAELARYTLHNVRVDLICIAARTTDEEIANRLDEVIATLAALADGIA